MSPSPFPTSNTNLFPGSGLSPRSHLLLRNCSFWEPLETTYGLWSSVVKALYLTALQLLFLCAPWSRLCEVRGRLCCSLLFPSTQHHFWRRKDTCIEFKLCPFSCSFPPSLFLLVDAVQARGSTFRLGWDAPLGCVGSGFLRSSWEAKGLQPGSGGDLAP